MINNNIRYIFAVLIILVFSSVALAGVRVEVVVGKGTILTLNERIKRITISDDEIAYVPDKGKAIDCKLRNGKDICEVLINGKKLGDTSLIVWNAEGKTSFFDVHVIPNISEIEARIKEMPLAGDITVGYANDYIVLSGTALNEETIKKVDALARAYAKEGIPIETTRYSAGVTETIKTPAVRVMNFIAIKDAQQVLLEVKVAQINKSKMKELGISVMLKGASAEGLFGLAGSPTGILGSGTSFNKSSVTTGTSDTNSNLNSSTRTSVFDNITNTLISDLTTNNNSSGAPNITSSSTTTQSNSRGTSLKGFDLENSVPQIGVTHFASGISVFLKALSTKGYGKILAEPNLVVRSGEKGDFHVGQRFPIQTVTGAGSDATVSIIYENVGVRLNFSPEVLETGAIRLTVDPAEVSNIVDFVRLQNLVAPIIDTRTIRTKVDLREGESLILAGLLRDQVTKNMQKIPLLGDIPILGAFFRNTSDTTEETELVFFITPKLVKPMAPGTKPELPTDKQLTPEQEREFNWIPVPKEREEAPK